MAKEQLTVEKLKKLKGHIGEYLSYKQIIEITGIERKVGGAKNNQIKILSDMFEIEKHGVKFHIIKEKNLELQIIDGRSKGSGTVFADDIEIVLLSLLKKSESNSCLYSATEALGLTSLVNDNYSIGRRFIKSTSEVLGVQEQELYTFYNKTQKRLKETFERALKRMANKSLVYYEKKRMVVTTPNRITLDGELIVETDIKQECRPATEDEIKIFLEMETEAMRSLGCASKQDVFLRGVWNEYQRHISDNLKTSNLHIKFYFDAYYIIANKDMLNRLGDAIDEEAAKRNINENVLKSLRSTAEKPLNGITELDIEYDIYKECVMTNIKMIEMLVNMNTDVNLKEEISSLRKIA